MEKRKDSAFALMDMESDLRRVPRLLFLIEQVTLDGVENAGMSEQWCETLHEVAICARDKALHIIEMWEEALKSLNKERADV